MTFLNQTELVDRIVKSICRQPRASVPGALPAACPRVDSSRSSLVGGLSLNYLRLTYLQTCFFCHAEWSNSFHNNFHNYLTKCEMPRNGGEFDNAWKDCRPADNWRWWCRYLGNNSAACISCNMWMKTIRNKNRAHRFIRIIIISILRFFFRFFLLFQNIQEVGPNYIAIIIIINTSKDR